MATPNYQQLMLPVLKFHADKSEHQTREIAELVADFLNLSDEDRNETLKTSDRTKFYDRINWALTYLRQAGLLISERRTYNKITERGLNLLSTNPSEITNETLKQYDDFNNFLNRTRKSKGTSSVENNSDDKSTPEDLIDDAKGKLAAQLETELLEKIKQMSPTFFEELVAKLLLAMGYGGSESDILQHRGKTGDGGIDGIIKQDTLGLDKIYIQAKRWESNVGKPEVQKFVGALLELQATKGVFITTAGFAPSTEEYTKRVPANIILINGDLLVKLMIEHNVGVQVKNTIKIKKIDENFFCEE